jgi:uncharacterized membrane protein YdfJ with MMPL/SSD domain
MTQSSHSLASQYSRALLRIKNKKFFGMPIPDRPLSREETKSLTEADLNEMGVETQFWPFYIRIVWSVAKIALLFLFISISFGYGTSYFSGTDYEISPVFQKALPLIGVALVAPIIVIVVSYLWWYGSVAFDKLLGKDDQGR